MFHCTVSSSFILLFYVFFFFFKQKTAYEMRISDWSSDVCSSDLLPQDPLRLGLDLSLRRAGVGLLAARGQGGRHLGRGALLPLPQIGRASCRERVCQYV